MLNVLQARILKSASLGGGNSAKEEERLKLIAEVNRKNQAIQKRPYEKYGGRLNLINYMKENEPENRDKKKSYLDKTIKKGMYSESKNLFTIIERFEMNYSEAQKKELIERVKNRRQ